MKGADWPGNFEIVNALENLHNPENKKSLQAIELEMHPVLEDPLPYPGNFATVYKGKLKDDVYALKIFTQKKSDQMKRYRKLSKHFDDKKIFENYTYFTHFLYLQDAIKINLTKKGQSALFPVIRMDWVEGKILENFIRDTDDPKIIKQISDNFLKRNTVPVFMHAFGSSPKYTVPG